MALGIMGFPAITGGTSNSAPANYPAQGLLVTEFDIWRPGYGGSTVTIKRAGTNELIACYSDISLTQEITNPQVLSSQTIGSTVYGKFAQSIYVPYAYELDIDGQEQTGVILFPISDLAGQDASDALYKVPDSTLYRRIKDRMEDTVYAEDYGEITTSPQTNSTTIQAAISKAANQGGGRVILPAGDIPFNTLTLSDNVVLTGQGRGVTTLQSTIASNVLTVNGNDAGIEELTLDGLLLNTGSVGIYGVNIDRFKIKDATVKRFATGLLWLGGEDHRYQDFYIDNCVRGARFLGDSNATGGSAGDEITGLDWQRGEVSTTTTVGLEFSVVDLAVRHNTIAQVEFDSNIGTSGAILLYGAQHTAFRQCNWTGNTVNLKVQDNPDDSLANGEVIGVTFYGGFINDGEMEFDGRCQDIVFDQCEFKDADFELNVPINIILLRDCIEDTTSSTGDTTKLVRYRASDHIRLYGTTEDDTTETVYKHKMASNEIIHINVMCVAEQVNGADYAAMHRCQSYRMAPRTLNYDGQTANFTVGDTITGQTSGATAIIQADSDSGATGTLSLARINGTFVDDEIITGATSGSARVNGMLSAGTAAKIASATEVHAVGSNSGSVPGAWGGVEFAVLGEEALVNVNGAAGDTILWTLDIDVVGI